jgi:peptidoglycan/LPS O-acetylase OafA/YrhL
MSTNTTRTSTAKYRPDIDGIRAIAILSVVLYHAGIIALPGGFTGVDIFFVISGYLIGGHIFSELHAGRFSFTRFYQDTAGVLRSSMLHIYIRPRLAIPD